MYGVLGACYFLRGIYQMSLNVQSAVVAKGCQDRPAGKLLSKLSGEVLESRHAPGSDARGCGAKFGGVQLSCDGSGRQREARKVLSKECVDETHGVALRVQCVGTWRCASERNSGLRYEWIIDGLDGYPRLRSGPGPSAI